MSGATNDAGGTVTYTVYTDSTCATQYSSAGAKTVASGVVPPSDPVTFDTAGTRYWRAVYSGDANNNGVSSGCTDEPITITPVVAATPCAPPVTGLVSCYSAEGNANDSADGNNGTLTGSATFGPGKVGTQAFSLPDSTAFVSLGNPANLRFTSGITVAAWVNPSQAPVTCGSYPYFASIVTKWDQNAGNNPASDAYGLWLCTSGASSNVFSAIHLGSGSGLSEPSLQGGSVPNNAWSHVAMTYDGASGQYSIYVNGVQVGSATAPGSLWPTSASVLIGHESSYLARPFVGSIDDARLYGRALSLSEIQTLAGVQPVAPAPPTLTAPATGFVTNQGQVTVTGTGLAGASVAISDGAAPAGTTTVDGTGHFGTSVALAAGNHSLTATQTVSGLSSAASNAVTVSVDTTAPVISITGVSDGQFSNAAAVSPSFSATDDHPGAVVATLDGAPFTDGTAVTAEGQHALVVTSQDAAGNAASASVHFTIDRTPPAIAVTGVTDGAIYGTPVSASFAASDVNLATVSATLDGTVFATGATVSGDGAHTLLVTATDLAGNSATTRVALTIDTAPPVLAVQSPANNAFLSSSPVAVSVTSTDAGSGIATVTANGVALLTVGGGTFSGAVSLVEGANTITVDAADKAGNHTQQRVSVTLDTQPPALQIVSPADGARIAALSTTVSGSVHDANLATLSANGQAVTTAADGSFSTPVALASGANTITMVATDRAGNTTTVTRSVQASTTPPSLSVSAPQPGLVTNASTVSVAGAATPGDGSDPGLLVVTVAGTPVPVGSNGSFATAVPLTQEGPFTIQLIVTDSFNLSSSASVSVIRDTAPPVVSISGITDGQYSNAASLSPAFSAADAHPGSVSATLDGASFSSGAGVSAEGSHTLVVSAQDAAGNSSSATAHFTIDRTPPAIAISGVTDGITYGAPVTLTFLATDANLGPVSATLDGSAFTTGSVVAADGAHTLVVSATDLAGNTATTNAHFTIDTAPPLLAVQAPANNTFVNSQPLPVSVTASDAGSGLAAVTANGVALVAGGGGAFSGTVPLVEGANTIAVDAVDRAGNHAQQSVSITLDTQPPALQVSSPQDGARIAALSATVTGSVHDTNLATLRVNGQAVSSASDGSFSTAVILVAGVNTLKVVATDTAGNTTTVTRSVKANATAPALSVSAPQAGLITNAGSVSVTGTATPGDVSDPAQLVLSVAGAPVPVAHDGSFSTSVPLVQDGPFTTQLTVTDSFSLSSSASVSVVRDSAPPVISITGVTDGQYSNALSLTPTFSAADAHPGAVAATLDGSPFTSGAQVSTEGQYVLVVTAHDAAGNSASVTVQFTIDRTPPVISITGVADGKIYGVAVSPSYAATDGNLATVSATLDGSVFVTGTRVSTDGAHTLVVTAIDRAGNSASRTLQFTVNTTPPVLQLPDDITTEATSPVGAAVPFTATASDAVDGALTVFCVPIAGATFLLGTTTVSCSATNAAGNTATGTFKVVVRDTTPPIISGTPGIVTAEATSSAGASVTYAGPTASDLVDGAVAVACSPAPGSNFGLGTTTITCTAKDTRNNAATTTFKVTVQDTTAPTFTVPANVSVPATSPNGAFVTYPIPVASDAVDQHPSVLCTPASGSQFPAGVSPASCTAKDSAGNTSAVQSSTITVTDLAPVVTPPADITAEATSHAGAVVTFAVTAATDVIDGTDPVSCLPVSGSTFAPGTATVTCSATNRAGKTGTATFTVTVHDTTPPQLALPADITTEATSSAGAAVTYAATANDAVDGNVPVTCTPASGATFALATTTVACSATDAAGNKGTGSFKVTVRDTTPPTISGTPGNITVPSTGPSGAVVTYTNPTATDLVGGSLAVSCAPVSGSTFALGVTTVTCSAQDPAGNKATSSFTVTVQAGAPTIAAPADGSRTRSTAVTVSGTGVNGAAITILDGGVSAGTATVDGTGHFSTTLTLTAGAHSLKATQTVSGVTSAASSAVSVFVDTTVPDTSITSTPRVLENRGIARFTFNAADDPDDTAFTLECLIDAGSFAACTSPKTYNGLADGSHTFKVRAIDVAGNVDPTPATFTWTVDATPPKVLVTSVDAPADGFLPAAAGVKLPTTVGAGPVTIHGTASDASGIAAVVVNGIPATVAADGSWTAVKVPLNPGANLIMANATDNAGNTAQLLPDPVVTLKLDLDGDGVANNIDGDCTVLPAKPQPTTSSTRFCDKPLGGRTSGSIVSKQPGMTVTITDATPNPTKGVTVKVTGSVFQRARIRLDRKAVTVALAPGTYTLTDPTLTTTVEALDGGTAEFEFTLNGSLVVVSVPNGAVASVTETQDAAGNLVGARVTPITGTVTINGVPVTPGQDLTLGKLEAKLDLGSGAFQLQALLTPGSGSNGINPAAEALTLQIGGISITIPAGALKPRAETSGRNQGFAFDGTINGIKLHVTVRPIGGRWEIDADGEGAKLAGTKSPVTVSVGIGDDVATTQVSLKGNE